MRPMLFLAAACALTAACGGDDAAPAAPREAAGTGVRYDLVRVGDDSLPAVIAEREGCDVVLTGGAVVFPGDRSYRSDFEIERRCPDADPEPLADPGTSGRVSFGADTAFFADSAGNPTGKGVLAAESLVVSGTIHRLVYVRELKKQ